jgi:predicted PurR-regulated permease PerM
VIHLNLSAATRWGLNGALILAAVVALYFGRTVFIPLTLALFLAAVLGPAALWMNNQGVPVPWLARCEGFPWARPALVRVPVPWTVACTLVVGALMALALLVIFGFGLAIPKMLQDLGDERRQAQVYEDFRKKLDVLSPLPLDDTYVPERAENSALFKAIRQSLDPNQPYIVNFLWGLASYGGSWVWQWILIVFILLFLLLEGRMLVRRVVEIFGPSLEIQTKATEALRDMASQVRTYLVWRTIVNFALGLILGLIYQYLGLSQPWTWAMVTAVLCYVPYLGPIAAGVPPVLDAFITSPSPWVAVAVLLIYLVVINVEGYLIVPVVMGRPMQLNATTVLLACLFWDLVWGTPGLFLAMPLMAAIKAVCSHVPDWQPWANLMSTGGAEPPPELQTEPAVRIVLGEPSVMSDNEPAGVGASESRALKAE